MLFKLPVRTKNVLVNRITIMFNITKFSIFLALLGILGGCATPARIEQMAAVVPPSAQPVNPALRNNIGVASTTGGRETNPMWTSQVSSEAFQRALELSLENSGLLSKIASGGKYQLTADLTRLDQPFMGIDMTVTATVRYSLVETQSRKEIYSKVIQVPFTAKFSDAALGVERLKLANEGAVKVNIQAFITDILALNIP